MTWRTTYKHKLVTADEAVKCIQSNNTVVPHHAFAEPHVLTAAMVKRAPELHNVRILNGLDVGRSGSSKPEYAGHFYPVSLFVGPSNREAIADGRGDFIPAYFSEHPRLFENELVPDVLMLHLSMPDANGVCSFGISADYSYGASQTAKTIIAQINPKMPFTHGTSISLDAIQYIVEHESDLPEMVIPAAGELDKAIAAHIAPLVEDGSTLQLGIGSLPNSILALLGGKKDLGIHTEVLSDGVLDLYEQGIITNNKKTTYPGKFVATVILGTKKLYDFADHNPDVVILPVDEVNNPYLVGQNPKLVSINSALQIDLMGQVNAEMIGPVHYSGVGGQMDFVRAARLSKGGKSIIALPSSADKGRKSRIVCQLDRGSLVTTPAHSVQYVATEYGMVNLRGLPQRERVKALISIAHPDFREDLAREAKEARIL